MTPIGGGSQGEELVDVEHAKDCPDGAGTASLRGSVKRRGSTSWTVCPRVLSSQVPADSTLRTHSAPAP